MHPVWQRIVSHHIDPKMDVGPNTEQLRRSYDVAEQLQRSLFERAYPSRDLTGRSQKLAILHDKLPPVAVAPVGRVTDGPHPNCLFWPGAYPTTATQGCIPGSPLEVLVAQRQKSEMMDGLAYPSDCENGRDRNQLVLLAHHVLQQAGITASVESIAISPKFSNSSPSPTRTAALWVQHAHGHSDDEMFACFVREWLRVLPHAPPIFFAPHKDKKVPWRKPTTGGFRANDGGSDIYQQLTGKPFAPKLSEESQRVFRRIMKSFGPPSTHEPEDEQLSSLLYHPFPSVLSALGPTCPE